MGVMGCRRNSCRNIMCDTYIPSVGYICYECKEEFKEHMKAEGTEDIPRGEIMEELESFMDSEKGYSRKDKMNIDDFFREFE